MLTKIQIANDPETRGDALDFNLGNFHERSGYVIRDIEGLEPPNSEISYVSYALLPGGKYQSSKVSPRNLIVRVGFDPDYTLGETIKSLRDDLYRLASPGELVRVRLWDDGAHSRRIDGYLESYEPVMFSKDPEVTLSIVCPQPYFVEPSMIRMTDLTPGTYNFDYKGDTPSGLRAEIEIIGTELNRVLLVVRSPGHYTSFSLNHDYSPGSKILLDSRPGHKSLVLEEANGSITRVIGKAVFTDRWPTIYHGPSRIELSGDSEGSFITNIRYEVQFSGF